MGYEEFEARAREMGLPVYQYQRLAAQRAMKLSAKLNASYHEPEEVVRLFSELIGKPVGEGSASSRPSPPTTARTSPSGRTSF